MKLGTKITATMAASILALAASPYSVIAEGTAEGDLSAECQDALRSLHASFLADHAAEDLAPATVRLQAEAGEPCGFNLFSSQVSSSQDDAIRRFVASLNRDAGTSTPPPPDLQLLVLGEACRVPGEGNGKMKAYLLGISFSDLTGAGEWEDTGQKAMEVGGSSGLLSGIQTGNFGTISVGPVPVPATDGWTAVACARVTEEISTGWACSYGYWVFGGEAECHAVMSTTSKLIACSGGALQRSIGDLVIVTHDYQVPGVEC